MKILYIITKSNWGGAQKHVFDLATAMKERGHEVTVALGGDGALRSHLEEAGIFTHSIAALGRDISLNKEAGSLKEIFSIIRSKRPDVLHLHSPKAAGLGAVAGRMLGIKKIIQTIHGWSFNEDRPPHQKALIIFFSWLTSILCHTTIVISHKEYTQALHFPGVKKTLTLIPMGLRIPTFISIDGAKQAMAKTIGMELGEFNKKILIVNTAELHPNKGQTYLVEAMKETAREHPTAICIIIGDGQEKSTLSTLIKKHELEKHIYLAGYVPNAAEYLKAFHIFVMPSVKEGLPYAILEAGAASLPVVATTVGGIPEIIDDMKSGILIQPKKTRELAHALSFMIEHADERRKYGTTLREKVVTHFSMEKMLTKVEEVYKTTVAQ